MRTRKTILILCGIVLLAGYYILGADYLRQQRETTASITRITEQVQALALVPLPLPDIGLRLDEARLKLAAATDLLPERANTTQVVNLILETAAECGIKAVPLVTQAWDSETIGESRVGVFRLSVTMTGTFDDMNAFLTNLEASEPAGLTIEEISVNRIINTGDGDPVEGIIASVQVVLFASMPEAQ